MSRNFTTTSRIMQYGLDNFRRNTWLTTAATIVMTITLLIIASSFILRMVFADTIADIRSRIDVSFYLSDATTPQQLEQLKSAIRKVPIVTEVAYISKEEARKIYAEQPDTNQQDLEALSELQSNPLPASLRVKTNNPNRLGEVSAVAARPEFKQIVQNTSDSGDRKKAIERIANASRGFEIGSLVASIVFVVISVLIIFNTIRMAIYNRKDEIQIMRLIGANPSFIRGPFLVEAALYGVVAAVISLILMYSFLLTQSGTLLKTVANDIVVEPTVRLFQQWPVLVVLAVLFVGVVIGLLSSLLATRRYLRE